MLDLGAAPGSWLEYASRRTGPDGFVLGVDISDIAASLPPWTKTLRADIHDLDPESLLREAGGPFDAVLSDAAPKTTGVPFADHARSVELSRRTLEIALRVLRPGGSWVCKVFQGEDLPPFRTEARKHFRKLTEAKPKSSRDRSVEIFLVGLGLVREEDPPGGG